MEELKPGDKVWHKSNYSTVWIIEKIEDGEARCSTLTKENEFKKEIFVLITLEKYKTPIKSTVVPKRSNHW